MANALIARLGKIEARIPSARAAFVFANDDAHADELARDAPPGTRVLMWLPPVEEGIKDEPVGEGAKA